MNKIIPYLLSLLISLSSIHPCLSTESPQYTVVHSESDLEIRLYRTSAWISAPSDLVSFHKATKSGFHRLFQYIQGANLNSTRIRLTKPFLTSLVPGTGPLNSSSFFIRLFLPQALQRSPPVPLPELRLLSDGWAPRCVAARGFAGFARDGNVAREAEALGLSLSKSGWGNWSDSTSAYSVAQYDLPFRMVGRVNEVWVELDGEGCGSGGVESY